MYHCPASRYRLHGQDQDQGWGSVSSLLELLLDHQSLGNRIWSQLDSSSRKHLFAVSKTIQLSLTRHIHSFTIHLPWGRVGKTEACKLGTFPFLPQAASTLLPIKGLMLKIRQGEVTDAASRDCLEDLAELREALFCFLHSAWYARGDVLSLVEHLVFQGCNLRGEVVEALTAAFPRSGQLTSLELASCLLDGASLFRVVAGMGQLRTLRLGRCCQHLGDWVEFLLSAAEHLPQLSVLEIQEVDPDLPAMDRKAIRALVSCMPLMRVFIFPACVIAEGGAEKMLKGWHLLSHLAVKRLALEGPFAAWPPKLTTLDLRLATMLDLMRMPSLEGLAVPSLSPVHIAQDASCRALVLKFDDLPEAADYNVLMKRVTRRLFSCGMAELGLHFDLSQNASYRFVVVCALLEHMKRWAERVIALELSGPWQTLVGRIGRALSYVKFLRLTFRPDWGSYRVLRKQLPSVFPGARRIYCSSGSTGRFFLTEEEDLLLRACKDRPQLRHVVLFLNASELEVPNLVQKFLKRWQEAVGLDVMVEVRLNKTGVKG